MTKKKKTIFAIMPFSKTPGRSKEDLTEFFITNLKEPIESADLKYQYIVKRSDDTFDITAQIIRDIYEADVVLCDLSGHHANPNVMYELGIRLSLTNKPVILFREKHDDNKPIFDIAGFHAYEYSCTQYRKLEKYIIDKINKFETGEERYESPVLKVLKTSPSIIAQMNKKRARILMDSLRHEAVALQRGLGNVQNFVSEFVTLVLPPGVAEAEASSENGHPNMLVGGAGFSWSGVIPKIFLISKSSYQSSSSLSSLPSKNIAS